MVELVLHHASRFDLLHWPLDYLHFPLARRQPTLHLTTLHGRRIATPFGRSPGPTSPFWGASRPRSAWTAPSRSPSSSAWTSTSPPKSIPWIGRTSRRSSLREPRVESVGEIGEGAKDDFLGHAHALLFPIDWPEPFGLVMIEAMACGTPVIAYRRGSVPEIIEDGVTGFMVDDLEAAVRAVEHLPTLSRWRCRQQFEARFSAARMARDYLAIYRRLVAGAGRPWDAGKLRRPAARQLTGRRW